MAGSFNKVILCGFLGADPDVKETQDGRKIVNLSVATSEQWKDKNTGEKRERTEWSRVVIFNEHAARYAAQYLRKGSRVMVEGQLQTRSWDDQSGNKRYATEVVLSGFNGQIIGLDSRKDGSGAGDYPDQGYEPGMDDEIPF